MELVESKSSMKTFSSIMRTKAVMFAPSCSRENDHFIKSEEKNLKTRGTENSIVSVVLIIVGNVVFILVPLSRKLSKVAQSSRLHLLSSKQKCSLRVCAGLLDAAKLDIFLKI